MGPDAHPELQSAERHLTGFFRHFETVFPFTERTHPESPRRYGTSRHVQSAD